MCATAIALSAAALTYDRTASSAERHWWREWIDVNTAEGARQLLSTIAGSTITVAGVVFSITVLILSFASSQHGPRLLRNFMRDRLSQFALGAFVSTYLYSLLVLRTIGNDSGAELPHVAIAGALVLGIGSMAVLVFFIHHIARAIQVSTIVNAVGRDLDALIRDYRAHSESNPQPQTQSSAKPAPRRVHSIRSRVDGYVQALSHEDLLTAAVEARGCVRMNVAPGDYVSERMPLATFETNETADAAPTLDAIRDAIVIGLERTNEQDLEFPIDQLAEMAVRALSPSLNDPFTAINCINRLGGALAELASFPWPESALRDDTAQLRVILLPTSIDRLLHRAFQQILHYGGSNPAIVRQVMKMLAQTAERAHPQHQPAIAAYADHVLRSVTAEWNERDRREVQQLNQRTHRPAPSRPPPTT